MSEGDAWTRDALGELRAGGYRPGAWVRFIDRSAARARTVRQERRREHRQTLLVGAIGLASWLAVAPFRPGLALAGTLWWVLAIAMLDWHLALLEDEHGRPLHRVGLPNLLSLARAAVVPVLPIASPGLLAAILIPVGISDGLDGPLARRRGEETRLGGWLDGAVDTFVLATAAVGAARHGLLPWWTAALVVVRHAAPWLVVSLAFFRRAAAPSRAGFVSGRAPGLVLFAGLAFAALRMPGALPLTVAGAAGGAATFGLTIVRTRRLQPGAP